MSVDISRFPIVISLIAASALIALATSATSSAEPAPPPPPAPGPLMLQAASPPPAPVPPPTPAPLVNAAAPVGPLPDAPPAPVAVPAATPVAAPPNGTPHLASPDALPVGTTMDPVAAGNESPNTSYLKDLWHAVQNQEISGKEALILGLSQRGMNTPIPTQAPGPNVPTQFSRDGAPPPPVDPALEPPAPLP